VQNAAATPEGITPMARMVVGTLVTLLLVLAPYTITTAQEPTLSSLIVKLRPGLSPTQQADVIARNGGVETSSVEPLRLHIVSVLTAELRVVVDRYHADPDVQHVETESWRQSGSVMHPVGKWL
jgi:hypothetical protein